MHIPDGFLNDAVSFGLGAGALGAVAHSFQKVKQEVRVRVAVVQEKLVGAGSHLANGAKHLSVSFASERVQQMALLGGLIFALQMINFPIQDGTSGHMIGAALATAVVGPYAAILVMTMVVSIQAIMFADGGLIALGANIINMAVVPAVLAAVIFASIRRKQERPQGQLGFFLGLAAWLSVILAATACSLELALSGTIALPDVLTAMVPVHALIGLGEAALSIAVFFLFFAAGQTYLSGQEVEHE